tara:strand:- start:1641 stop:3569 length:1929 start_codon:yes stop_codon:yes gene_type:complete
METKYRPDIDGLRAISIIFVIIYHLKIPLGADDFLLFSGGYLGVDIFFVISGYLVFNLIRNQGNNVIKNYIDFINRRLKRILPALLIFLIILFIIIKKNFNQHIEFYNLNISNIFNSLLFASNELRKDYFSPSRDANLSYHTWSLSIEMQIYIFYSIFLIIITKFKKYFQIGIFFLILILSGFLMQFGANLKIQYPFIEKQIYFFNQPYWAGFNSPISRIFEFTLGVVCNFVMIKNSKKLSEVLCITSIFIILFSVIIFNDITDHPSILTIPILISTCLIIVHSPNSLFFIKIISNKIMCYMGKISYSAYLYHVPIIFFINYYLFDNHLLVNLFLIFFFTFLSSLISYEFIEKKFRKKNNFIFYVFIFFSYSFFLFNFINFDRTKLENNKLDELTKEREIYVKNYSKEIVIVDETIEYSSSNFNNTKKNVLIVGNSLSQDFFIIFQTNKNLFKDYEFKFFRMHLSNFLEKREKDKKKIEFFKQHQLFNDSDIIFISSNFRKYGRYSEDIDSLLNIKNLADKHSKKLILTSNSPQFESIIDPVQDILFKYKINKKDNNKFINEKVYQRINKKEYKKNQKVFDFAKKNNLTILDKIKIFCTEEIKICHAVENDKVLIKDSLHVSIEGAKYFGKKIYETNWFKID